ncbi:phosphoglycerate dehydrogenase [Metabacillus arenae]|uniref:Phosphoglycerate dehydrogenase n=1 Tax=Metabacillus arenae TaxID=2771434 RepID=A0A926NE89_9BACI|nr:phosphoglycerate dehydrogenase [Metabacillus arenae]MBD1382642.1 phosphoglycerate dehydrogenase [Metabacillus arenae]
MKVVCTSPSFAKYSDEPVQYLTENGIELIRLPADIEEEEFIRQSKDAYAAIVAFNRINENVLEQLPNLTIICKHGVGVDNIDLPAAKKRNVFVTNVPNANKHAVADYAFGLMLALARKIPQGVQQTKNGEWPRIFGSDVYGKTIGIVGLGMIGKEVAKRAKGFNMNILAFDPYPDQTFAAEYQVEYVELTELLKNSDFVTLHMPLIEETKNLISKAQFQLMKKNAFLVNASRGCIVSEEDLYDALINKEIAGAALDVFALEPLESSPLYDLDQFIAMPHAAGYTSDAVNTLGMVCVKNIVDVLNHRKTPQYMVNT